MRIIKRIHDHLKYKYLFQVFCLTLLLTLVISEFKAELSTATLSESRNCLSTMAVGNKDFFAGVLSGSTSSNVAYIYKIKSNNMNPTINSFNPNDP
ncbi:MAG: hypothetical protein RIA69_12785, partial [Cyclobacteriaceae bacterium]